MWASEMKIFFMLLSFVCTTSTAGTVCELNLPTKKAGINANHGYFYFIEPRIVPPTYTGCQIMWDEKGKKKYVLNFSKGQLKQFEEYEQSSRAIKVTCVFTGGRATRRNSKNCPSDQDLKNGFFVLSDELILEVPEEKDPRR